jgi:hypothetical protein
VTDPSFSNTIVYVDESGDHGLTSIDPGYPVFVLLFVVFRTSTYINQFVPAVGSLKFRLFGHDGVILHEREIRKDLGPFAILRQREKKEEFLEEINQIVTRTPFEVIASVHDKRRLRGSDAAIEHLYHQGLRFGIERLYARLHRDGEARAKTHLVFEARGDKEDRELTHAFRRACDGENSHGCPLPFDIVITDKRANSVGLQLADLIARPVGLHFVRPEQPNRAFELIRQKLMEDPAGVDRQWGLRCFP